MNPAALSRLTEAELADYARVMGVDISGEPSREGRERAIEARRGRSVTVRAMGLDLTVPVKRAHDKRVVDLMPLVRTDDEAAMRAFTLLVGEPQAREAEAACTDEDGTVDVEALSLLIVKVLTCRELKNF